MTAHAYEVLLIGGRSGVGKSTVAWEVSELLQAAAVPHCLLEGDYLGQVHPAPDDDPHRSAVAERNLKAVWANFAALGHRRLIYTNTVSVLETGMFRRAVGRGEPVRIVRVLLTADDATARERLVRRESGSLLDAHVARSASAARRLEAEVPAGTVRVGTDRRSVAEIAREVVGVTGW